MRFSFDNIQNIPGNEIGSKRAVAIAKTLKILSISILFISLQSHKQIGDAGGTELGKALKVNRTLNNAEIGDEAANSFGEVLKDNSIIVWLCLSIFIRILIKNNEIGDAGRIAIDKVVVNNESLLRIDLGSLYINYKY